MKFQITINLDLINVQPYDEAKPSNNGVIRCAENFEAMRRQLIVEGAQWSKIRYQPSDRH